MCHISPYHHPESLTEKRLLLVDSISRARRIQQAAGVVVLFVNGAKIAKLVNSATNKQDIRFPQRTEDKLAVMIISAVKVTTNHLYVILVPFKPRVRLPAIHLGG